MEAKLKCIRLLDDPSEEMASEMAHLVVHTLVRYSAGRAGSGTRGEKDFDYGFYPYGKIPA